MEKLEVYKKYFKTARDDTHLVMHRGYALALVKMLEEQQTKANHFMKDVENKQVIIYQLQRKLEEMQNELDWYKSRYPKPTSFNAIEDLYVIDNRKDLINKLAFEACDINEKALKKLDDEEMKPKLIEDKWYIEVSNDEFDKVFLLEKGGLAIPIRFDTEQEALDYIKL